MMVRKSFKTIDFEQVNEYEGLRKNGWAGFGNVYLERCTRVLNFSVKRILRRICHVMIYARNLNFSAFAIEELFQIKACQ